MIKTITLIAATVLLASCSDSSEKLELKPCSATSCEITEVKPCSGASCELPEVQPCLEKAVKKTPTFKGERTLWAKSFLWQVAPKIVVEEWFGEKPDLKDGKFLLVEFWNTWCPPCRKSLVKLSSIHEKYKEHFNVVAITDETELAVSKLQEKYNVAPPTCFKGSAPKMFTKKALGVTGVPHVIIIEPNEGVVIWEGFPLQKGYELTEDIIERIIKIKQSK